MIALELKSWKIGIKTLSLALTIRENTAYSLTKEKAAVERLLDRETVTLEFSIESEREDFKRLAESRGAVCS